MPLRAARRPVPRIRATALAGLLAVALLGGCVVAEPPPPPPAPVAYPYPYGYYYGPPSAWYYPPAVYPYASFRYRWGSGGHWRHYHHR